MTLVVVAVLVAAVAIANHAEARWLRAMRHGIAIMRQTAGSGVARVAFVTAYTLLLTIGLPGGPLMLLGGAAFGPITGSIVNLISITLGAAGGYWLARALGERLPRQVLHLDPQYTLMALISLQINPVVPTIAYSYFAGALLSAGSTSGGVGRELGIAAIVLAFILLIPIFAGRWRTT